MSKFKNCNIALATVFSAVSVISALVSLGYIFIRYPISVNSIFLFASELLIFFSDAFLLTGIIFSRKISIKISGILLLSKVLINAVFFLLTKIIQGLYYPLFYSVVYGYNIFNFILLAVEIAVFFIFLLYTFDVIKNRNLIFTLLFISWLTEILVSGELTPALFIISAYLLLMKYTDITNPSTKVNMGEIFALSVVTFGIYYILWSFTAVKKCSMLLSRKAPFTEYLFFLLFPPYTAYWYYTVYEDLNEADERFKNRGILCLVLSLIFMSPMALCILQRDLNMFCELFVPFEEFDETEASDENTDTPCDEAVASCNECSDETPAEVVPEE